MERLPRWGGIILVSAVATNISPGFYSPWVYLLKAIIIKVNSNYYKLFSVWNRQVLLTDPQLVAAEHLTRRREWTQTKSVDVCKNVKRNWLLKYYLVGKHVSNYRA